MRIVDKDEKGEGYLELESKEDLEEFRRMLVEECKKKGCYKG
jgi:hypothetical protein